MKNDVKEITIKGVMPTGQACAVFLGPEDKTFVIYVDPNIGNAISMAINKTKKERPQTHDLINNIFIGLDVQVERIVINHVDEEVGTFFARLILKMDNEVATKLVEIDARPSDSLVLALQAQRPMFAATSVLESVEDMTEVLERILKQQN